MAAQKLRTEEGAALEDGFVQGRVGDGLLIVLPGFFEIPGSVSFVAAIGGLAGAAFGGDFLTGARIVFRAGILGRGESRERGVRAQESPEDRRCEQRNGPIAERACRGFAA